MGNCSCETCDDIYDDMLCGGMSAEAAALSDMLWRSLGLRRGEGRKKGPRAKSEVTLEDSLALTAQLYRFVKRSGEIDLGDRMAVFTLPPICRLMPEYCHCQDTAACDSFDCREKKRKNQCFLWMEHVWETLFEQAERSLGLIDIQVWESEQQMLKDLQGDKDYPADYLDTDSFTAAKQLVERIEALMAKLEEFVASNAPPNWLEQAYIEGEKLQKENEAAKSSLSF